MITYSASRQILKWDPYVYFLPAFYVIRARTHMYVCVCMYVYIHMYVCVYIHTQTP